MKMGIIPDKFILLNQDDDSTLESVSRKIDESYLCQRESAERKAELAKSAVLEYNL